MAVNYKFDLKDPNSEKSSIKFRFDYKGKRFVYGTGQSTFTKLWNHSTQRPTGTSDKKILIPFLKDHPQIKTEQENLSQRLENIISATKTFFGLKEQQKATIDFKELKAYLDDQFNPIKAKRKETPQAAPETPQAPFIKDLIHEYIKGMYTGSKKTKQRLNYDHETIKAYMTFKNMFAEMESHFKTTYQVTDISMDFENDLHEFFNDVKEYTPNTKGKMIKMIKVIIHDFLETESQRMYDNHKKGIESVLSLIDLNYIQKQLDRIIKPTSKPVHIALNEKELQSLYELDLSDKPHLDRARDIFLIGCYSGLRHSDYSRVGPEHINNDFIQIIMFKTKEKVFIPFTPELVEILKKWDYKIPDMTIQELGRYIKILGHSAGIIDIVEITEDKGNQTIISRKPKFEMITTHTARRSFATNMFYTGMNSMDIMKITGHKKLETFQKYIIYDPEREKQRQELLRKFQNPFLKVV